MTKKMIFIIVLVGLFLVLPTNFVKAQAISPTALKVKVAIYENPPKIYTDSNGVVKGFWADLINYMATKENWSVEYVHGTFNEGLNKLSANQVDIMVDVGYSPQRAMVYDFTGETAFINWAGVYSSKSQDVNSFKELDGKKIAVLDGDIHYLGPLGIKVLMNSFGYNSAIYVPENSYADVLQAVSDGSADFGVVNRLFGSSESGNYQVQPTSIIFDPVELKFAFSKTGTNTKYLLPTIDSDLKALKADNNSIYYKSILSNLSDIVQTVEVTPSWLAPLLGISFGLAIILILMYLISRRYQKMLEQKVKEKTKELEDKVNELELAMRLMIEKGY